MKTEMTPEKALSTLDKWRKCTIPMEKHAEAVGIIRKVLKEKARQDDILNMLKETIAYETSLPVTRIDEEGNAYFTQAVVLRQLKELEERKRKLLRDWILRECFPKELKALEIMKQQLPNLLLIRNAKDYDEFLEKAGDNLTEEEYNIVKGVLL